MELAKIDSNKESSPSIDSLELLVPETQQRYSMIIRSKSNFEFRTRRGAAVHARKKVQNLIQKGIDDDDDNPINERSSSTETLKTIRTNRSKRATSSEKRTHNNTTTTSSSSSAIHCPICDATFDRDFDINLHIDSCLQPSSSSTTRPMVIPNPINFNHLTHLL